MSRTTPVSKPPRQTRTFAPLQQLRKDAGYRSAREFAETLGIPASTYSRYEKSEASPESLIPMKAAWRIADKLGSSIDAVVGRELIFQQSQPEVSVIWHELSPSSQECLVEYARYLQFRDRMLLSERR